MKRSRRLSLATALIAVALVGWGVRSTWVLWRDHRDAVETLRLARINLASDRWNEARKSLTELSTRQPGRGDVEFLLGVCESASGRVDDALAAWGRVPHGAPEAAQAAIRRARLAVEAGRFAVAELALAEVAPADAEEAGRLRTRLWLSTARVDDLRDQLRRDALRDPNPATLRQLWLLDSVPFPVGPVGGLLEKAGREAPDDDRVWLGRANLAIQVGQLDEADRWLTRSETRRPADSAVAHARFLWAMNSDRIDVAVRAMAAIPESERRDRDLLRLHARHAAVQGEGEAERRWLDEILAREPGDVEALGRLTDLTRRLGPPERLPALLSRKTEIDSAHDRYRALWSHGTGPDQGAVAAPMAEMLGRLFDARCWWELAQRQGSAEVSPAIRRLDALANRPPIVRTLAGLSSKPTHVVPTRVLASPVELAFQDEAESVGLRFAFHSDRSPLRRLPETMSGGDGVLDYDGDGWLDVYVVQGGTFPPDPTSADPSGGDRLFRNLGNGRFEDVTVASGIASFPRGYGHGVAVGDHDNDGHPDLFLTRWRGYALYRNRGDGTFEDATNRAGLGGDRDWPTSAAFADLDNDGDLDLFVCHYLAWDPDASPPCDDPPRPGHVYCTPRRFPALADHLFRNDGGRYVDVTAEAGITDREGRGLGVVAADLDEDGLVDLYVANDMSANALYHNQGGMKFREVAMEAGAAANGDGGYQAGMGIACGDLDGDGRIDLAVTNFYGESTTFYQNLGHFTFADRTRAIGLATPSRLLLGFGASFLDANNDGHLDLATTNGHVNDFRPNLPHEMPAQLLLGGPSGRLTEVTTQAGACWSIPRLGRGLALGDLDNDGKSDLLILAQDAPLAYFHNTGPAGHSLTLRLEGTTSNRDAIGARVTLHSGGRRQVATRFNGGSYLSAGDPRLHFGLGKATQVDSIEIRWPSGRVDEHRNLTADRIYHIREGTEPTVWQNRRSSSLR